MSFPRFLPIGIFLSPLCVIGIVLGIPLSVEAVAPAIPANLISEYAQELVDTVQSQLSSLPGGSSACDKEALQHELVVKMETSLLDVQRRTIQPAADPARSACFISDIRKLERYGAEIFQAAIDAGASCNVEDAYATANAFAILWDGIHALRLHGLDPEAKRPITSDNPVTLSSDLDPARDDGTCPYTSYYADPTPGEGGCLMPDTYFIEKPSQALSEAALLSRIAARIASPVLPKAGNIPESIVAFLAEVYRIISGAHSFVTSLPAKRVLSPPAFSFTSSFLPVGLTNRGESGCLGWSTNTPHAFVTGENMALQNFRGTLLTQDMERVISYLLLQKPLPHYDYYSTVRSEGAKIGSAPLLALPGERGDNITTRHSALQRHIIVSMIDPQQQMEAIATQMHRQSVSFASLAARKDTTSPLPLLRQFVVGYASFLARMCPLRNCSPALLRAIELSEQQECFGAFFLDQFFSPASGSSTLGICRASFGL